MLFIIIFIIYSVFTCFIATSCLPLLPQSGILRRTRSARRRVLLFACFIVCTCGLTFGRLRFQTYQVTKLITLTLNRRCALKIVSRCDPCCCFAAAGLGNVKRVASMRAREGRNSRLSTYKLTLAIFALRCACGPFRIFKLNFARGC